MHGCEPPRLESDCHFVLQELQGALDADKATAAAARKDADTDFQKVLPCY